MTPNNLPATDNEPIVIEQETVVAPAAETVIEKKTIAVKAPRPVKRRSSAGIFDVPEIVAVSVGGLLLLLVALSYLFWLLPARETVRQRELTRNKMEKDLQDLQQKIGENKTTESRVGDIVGSVDRFEMNFLSAPNQGNASLYGRLNELIRSNGLRNTAGPSYAPLNVVSPEKLKDDERAAGGGKFQSLYPGTGVSVTVEGSYAGLRRFISELENSRQFVVINAMEIESNGEQGGSGGGANNPAATNNVPPMGMSGIPPEISGIPNAPGMAPNPNRVNPRAPQTAPKQPSVVAPNNAQPAARQRGAVSMRLELAAYFRRNAPPAPIN